LKFALAQDEDQSMKRNRFTKEQIIGILKEHETDKILDFAPAETLKMPG
jgi:hypothetical protein